MANKILYIFLLFGILTTISPLTAQDNLPKNWNSVKIKGTRHDPYTSYSGRPYLNDKFSIGEIEFLDGSKVDDIGLRYSSYRDELIYYNTAISAQIVIDKISLKGFILKDNNGVKRIFRQQYYDGFLPGNRFFEVLSDGNISLLAYRKVVLLICPTYTDKTGKIKNMSYQEEYNYYIYAPDKGYDLIKISRNSFLSKFDKTAQKLVKKILRRNNVYIKDEQSFVRAFNLIKENNIKINFRDHIK